jgi:NAD(P)-dependent dehydrogenase (short-subunit alcohol dehydrogenase family)
MSLGWRRQAAPGTPWRQPAVTLAPEFTSGAHENAGPAFCPALGVIPLHLAPAKAAQRSLAESMARKLWPKGIHVALIIIDGIVDTPRTREYMPDKPADAFVSPAALAEAVHTLAVQDHHVWSFEMEVRPYVENW